jgi:putative MATE family efflux protein
MLGRRKLRFGSPSRDVWGLAYPILLGSLAQILLGTVDTIMLGRLSSSALAAAGIGTTAFLTVVIGLGAICLGVQALTARRFGEKRFTHCGRVLDNALLFASTFGIVVAIASPWLSRALAQWLQSDPEMGGQLSRYLEYRFYGTAFVLINASFGGFFGGIGRTRVRMGAAVLLTGINIVLDVLLIFGHAGFPALGAKGAALASTIATAAATTYYVVMALVGRMRERYGVLRVSNLDRGVFRQLIRVSLPLMIRTVARSGGFTIFLWIVGRIGTVPLAASQVLTSLNSIAYMLGAALGAGATTLVGQSLGAKEPERATRVTWAAVRLGLLGMGALGCSFLIAPGALIRIYTSDPAVVAAGSTALRILGFAQFVNAIGAILGPALIGAGDMRFVMGLEFVTTYVLFLPLAWFLGIVLKLGVAGAWAAELVYVVGSAVGTALRIRRGGWRTIHI